MQTYRKCIWPNKRLLKRKRMSLGEFRGKRNFKWVRCHRSSRINSLRRMSTKGRNRRLKIYDFSKRNKEERESERRRSNLIKWDIALWERSPCKKNVTSWCIPLNWRSSTKRYSRLKNYLINKVHLLSRSKLGWILCAQPWRNRLSKSKKTLQISTSHMYQGERATTFTSNNRWPC